VAEQVDDESFAQCVVDTLVGKRIADVEQVAWVLGLKTSLANPERVFNESRAVLAVRPSRPADVRSVA
jgi:hypothetical protein